GAVRFSSDGNKATAYLHSPTGSLATIGLPRMGKRMRRITVNGADVYPRRNAQNPPYAIPTEDDGFVYVPDLPSGSYEIDMEYEDEQHKSHPPKTKKRNANHTELVSVDSTTSTDWVDRYGRDGYFLFDHQGNAAQQNTLPDYVEKIV